MEPWQEWEFPLSGRWLCSAFIWEPGWLAVPMICWLPWWRPLWRFSYNSRSICATAVFSFPLGRSAASGCFCRLWRRIGSLTTVLCGHFVRGLAFPSQHCRYILCFTVRFRPIPYCWICWWFPLWVWFFWVVLWRWRGRPLCCLWEPGWPGRGLFCCECMKRAAIYAFCCRDISGLQDVLRPGRQYCSCFCWPVWHCSMNGCVNGSSGQQSWQRCLFLRYGCRRDLRWRCWMWGRGTVSILRMDIVNITWLTGAVRTRKMWMSIRCFPFSNTEVWIIWMLSLSPIRTAIIWTAYRVCWKLMKRTG